MPTFLGFENLFAKNIHISLQVAIAKCIGLEGHEENKLNEITQMIRAREK